MVWMATTDAHSEPAAPELSGAIDGLYLAFERYRLPSHVDGCPHCVDDTDHAKIHSSPLRQLCSDDLAMFAFKAMTTWGSVEDFKHMLPRIFELQATDRHWGVDLFVTLGKLDYGKWKTWPPEEQSTVEIYLRACWNAGLNGSPDMYLFDATEWLIGLICRENTSRSALEYLACFVCENFDQLAANTLPHLWLGDRLDQARLCAMQLRAWLSEPELIATMEAFALVDTSEPFAHALAGGLNTATIAAQQLHQLRGDPAA
jgi:hypothetical protein